MEADETQAKRQSRRKRARNGERGNKSRTRGFSVDALPQRTRKVPIEMIWRQSHDWFLRNNLLSASVYQWAIVVFSVFHAATIVATHWQVQTLCDCDIINLVQPCCPKYKSPPELQMMCTSTVQFQRTSCTCGPSS